MATQDFESPVAAIHLATGVIFFVKVASSTVAAIQLAAGAFFVKMTTRVLTRPVAANNLAAGAFSR